MPDLLTHTLMGLIVHKIKKINNLLIFLIGNISPDIIGRVVAILFPKFDSFFKTFHSFSSGVIIALLFSYFFQESKRKSIFLFFLAGNFFHLALDLIQKDIFDRGYTIFFPFSKIRISIGFIWPEVSVYLLPALLALVTILYRKELLQQLRKRKNIG